MREINTIDGRSQGGGIPRRRQRDIFRDDMVREMPGTRYCMRRVDGRPVAPMLRRQFKRAVGYPYIQINPPWLVLAMTFDIDRGGGVLAWEDANLPEPLAGVINRDNNHAHLIYGLAAPVLRGFEARRRPANLLAAIEGAMTERLQADPGYSGLIAKNPFHNAWRTLWSREPARYELKFLAEFLTDAEIDRHWPWKRNRKRLAGIGRNLETFHTTRLWSYIAIREFWPVAGERRRPAFDAWQDAVTNHARCYNAENYPGREMADSECRAIGKSIAKWTWAHFDPVTLAVMKSNAARRSGLKSGRIRRESNAPRDAAIIEGRMAGARAAELAAEHGLTRRRVEQIVAAAGLHAK